MTIPFLALGAAIIVSIDTIAWLLCIFALSGPILVSGVYEAFLDNVLLVYLQNNMNAMSTASCARILYTVLAGNLDIDAVPDGESPSNSVWNHIYAADADPSHPENDSLLRELITPNHAPNADRTKTRLRSMLASQYSFGVIVGAPVVFFCASFIYNLLDNYSNLGDNDTSHALGKFTLISSGEHSSIITCSIWDVVDDDTSHRHCQWITSGWK